MIKRIASAAVALGGAMAAGAVYMRARSRTPKTVITKVELPREVGATNLDRVPNDLSLDEMYNRVSFAS